MALVRLKIPVLVKNTKVENQMFYHVRPLFVGHPVASNRRLELALARLKDEVRQYFKGFVLERENADQLLWYLFNPEQEYHLFPFDFRSGDIQVNGSFGLSSFILQGLTFACLPNVRNFMFIVGEGQFHKPELRDKTEKVLKRLLPQLRKDQKEIFEIEAFYSDNREFITQVEVNINILFGPFQYEILDNSWIFARLREDADFDGSLEIEKVGLDLNSRYPAELGRAFYQDKLIEKIYHIIYQEENTPLVIVGREGVGKHALINEVVWRYQSEHYNKIKGESELLWHLDPTRVISGMSIQGMWQKRFEAIIAFIRNPVQKVNKSYKMLIDNPVALLRIGKSANTNMTLSDVLKPYLE
ncbi:MAG: ATP-dependent Clp protease ATP-binding subunit, partial [Saprospiraceae bacterium]|nr:ATP-dependent Clp protease ATP-binding subunit [Saprospiraceae bacterium]